MFRPLLVIAALIGLGTLIAYVVDTLRSEVVVAPVYYLCPRCSAHCRAERGDWYFKCPDTCGRFVTAGRSPVVE